MVRPLSITTVILLLTIAFGQDKKTALTFLDTLNKGREAAITVADLVPHVAQPVIPLLDTGSSSAEQKREAGVVPSRFRIQVLASTQEQAVKKEKSALAAKTMLSLAIIFEPPYYKLFAGDFVQRGDAENSCSQLKKMGYNDAWIVRTAVDHR